MKHIMLDIETMGSGSNSAIVSIGAVKFDLDSGDTGEFFHKKVCLNSSVKAGGVINPNTVSWWLKQHKDAQLKLITGELVDIETSLRDFADFCKGDYEIWGNSARFDCGILSDAYNNLDMKIPWDFRKERCLRTLVSFSPDIKENFIFKGTAHDALDDCYNQIEYACLTWQRIHGL